MMAYIARPLQNKIFWRWLKMRTF